MTSCFLSKMLFSFHESLRSQYTCSSTLPSRIESADKRKEITISPNRASSKRFDPNKEKGYPLEPNPGKLCTDVYRLDERDARPIFRGFRGGKRWTKRQLTSGHRNHYYRSLVSDSSLSKRMDSNTPRQYSGRRRRKGSEQSGGKLIGGGGIPLVPFVRPDDVSSLVFHRTPPLFPRLGPADRKLATVVFRTERRQPRDLRRLPAVQILPRQSSNVFFSLSFSPSSSSFFPFLYSLPFFIFFALPPRFS